MSRSQAEGWNDLPENVVSNVSHLLNFADSFSAASTCSAWWIAYINDNERWRRNVAERFSIKERLLPKCGELNFRKAFVDCMNSAPIRRVWRGVARHEKRVVHIGFDEKGELMATCGLDGVCRVWRFELRQEMKMLQEINLEEYRIGTVAETPQYSEFCKENPDLLLISGRSETFLKLGHIYVFDISKYEPRMMSYVTNEPQAVLGCWSGNWVISGKCSKLSFENEEEVTICVNAASPRLVNPRSQIQRDAYQFLFRNQSMMREMTVLDAHDGGKLLCFATAGDNPELGSCFIGIKKLKNLKTPEMLKELNLKELVERYKASEAIKKEMMERIEGNAPPPVPANPDAYDKLDFRFKVSMKIGILHSINSDNYNFFPFPVPRPNLRYLPIPRLQQALHKLPHFPLPIRSEPPILSNLLRLHSSHYRSSQFRSATPLPLRPQQPVTIHQR